MCKKQRNYLQKKYDIPSAVQIIPQIITRCYIVIIVIIYANIYNDQRGFLYETKPSDLPFPPQISSKWQQFYYKLTITTKNTNLTLICILLFFIFVAFLVDENIFYRREVEKCIFFIWRVLCFLWNSQDRVSVLFTSPAFVRQGKHEQLNIYLGVSFKQCHPLTNSFINRSF